MKHSRNKTEKNRFIFRKWARKRYALFSVLKTEVKICVIPVIYCLSLPVLSIAAEPDSTIVHYGLDEIEISASRAPSIFPENTRVLYVIDKAEIEQSPATSIQDLLKQVASVDVRQRGAEGVQADISIRGGTFDQTLILLNGINMTDPQTGHHNLNLPVSLSQIERIEVLEGPAARIYGPNAFSGAINIITLQPRGNRLSAQADAGSFNYFNFGVSANFCTGKGNHLLTANRKSSSGYTENTDFEISDLFYTGQAITPKGNLQVQAGVGEKGFGANSFYTPVYPNQYEQVRTMFSSARWISNSKFHVTPAIYWRRHFDTFMLFRDHSPDLYKNHNFHRTDLWGVNLNTWMIWKGGKTSLGTEYRTENILSNVLGEPLDLPVNGHKNNILYTHSKTRNITSLFLEHALYLNNWVINFGIMANHISGNHLGWNFFPGVDVSYQIRQSLRLVASWNSSLRMPTFTDLYYSSPTNIGNPDLKPEKSETMEGGFKIRTEKIRGHLILFSRLGKNTIDWIRTTENEPWQSMNHTKIHSKGAEFTLQVMPENNQNTKQQSSYQISYLFNVLNKKETPYISHYVLDNLKHKLTVSVTQPISGHLSAGIGFTFQDRAGSFTLYETDNPPRETPYPPFWLADVKVLYHLNKFQFFVSANNLLNKEYFDLGNVPQPGRWMKAGVSFNLNFDNE
ncbi:MAG: TonB-dependent receptor [Mariniphaga sp.]